VQAGQHLKEAKALVHWTAVRQNHWGFGCGRVNAAGRGGGIKVKFNDAEYFEGI
jgi:hypothetical protein